MPTSSDSLNIALSKFVLKESRTGGLHFFLTVLRSLETLLFRACNTFSGSVAQRWHSGSWRMVLFSRFSLVGREFVYDFHRKCLIFPRVFSFQMPFQNHFFFFRSFNFICGQSWLFLQSFVICFDRIVSRIYLGPNQDIGLWDWADVLILWVEFKEDG